jgi:L-2-hydroxyglutarate oxidase LhgO
LTRRADFLVIGAGILGLSIARELKRRQPGASLLVLEKESGPGRHSSGRNSGVLHSGLYYAPGSLKARLCRKGAAEMAAFHEEHGLPFERRGKILTPTTPGRAEAMATIAERAGQNGVQVEWLDERALREMEPETRSATGKALWVPATAVGDPMAVIRLLVERAGAEGVEIRFASELFQARPEARRVSLKNGETLHFGQAVNAAGLFADRVAHLFGAARHLALLPFKGLYWRLAPEAGFRLDHLIYPVPDLRILYLGVHTTTAVDGAIYLGPTAVPAWGRENYQGFSGISPLELPGIAARLARMFLADRNGFRAQAWQEGRRYFKRWFFPAAQSLLPRLEARHLLPAAKIGLHPRIFDRTKGALLEDFTLEKSPHALHILGATSPAWTSAFPFARHVCETLGI